MDSRHLSFSSSSRRISVLTSALLSSTSVLEEANEERRSSTSASASRLLDRSAWRSDSIASSLELSALTWEEKRVAQCC